MPGQRSSAKLPVAIVILHHSLVADFRTDARVLAAVMMIDDDYFEVLVRPEGRVAKPGQLLVRADAYDLEMATDSRGRRIHRPNLEPGTAEGRIRGTSSCSYEVSDVGLAYRRVGVDQEDHIGVVANIDERRRACWNELPGIGQVMCQGTTVRVVDCSHNTDRSAITDGDCGSGDSTNLAIRPPEHRVAHEDGCRVVTGHSHLVV